MKGKNYISMSVITLIIGVMLAIQYQTVKEPVVRDTRDTFELREDLVKEENAQLVILETYLPKLMERSEVETIVKAKKEELGITDATKKGMLMSSIMTELKGKADGKVVKEVVDSLF